jgi:hypothetical protein
MKVELLRKYGNSPSQPHCTGLEFYSLEKAEAVEGEI